jgi:serine phosphatase RsbU (regulator of sigma subunit)
MSQDSDNDGGELRRLHSKVEAQARDIRDMGEHGDRQERVIERLRREVELRDAELAALRGHLDETVHELEDLRAVRDALTPPALPERPGLDLAAAFVPAAERVSGDFYLVAEGPRDSTLLVIGDVMGHGVQAGRRAAFVRTAFAATAPFSDDPRRLLSWANTALVERAGTSTEFVTAACVTYLPDEQLLRWAYAGHPPALWIHDGQELAAPTHGFPLGVAEGPEYVQGSFRCDGATGLLLYTDGLTEARHGRQAFGLQGVAAVLSQLQGPSAGEAVDQLRTRVSQFSGGVLTDDLCMLAACIA